MRAIIGVIGITAVLLTMLAGCCWSWHGTVIVKTNPKDTVLSDFCVTGPVTQRLSSC